MSISVGSYFGEFAALNFLHKRSCDAAFVEIPEWQEEGDYCVIVPNDFDIESLRIPFELEYAQDYYGRFTKWRIKVRGDHDGFTNYGRHVLNRPDMQVTIDDQVGFWEGEPV